MLCSSHELVCVEYLTMACQFCAKCWDSACFVGAVNALVPQCFVHVSKDETDHIFQDRFGMT